jgi:hypothetical protein
MVSDGTRTWSRALCACKLIEYVVRHLRCLWVPCWGYVAQSSMTVPKGGLQLCR